MPGPHRYPLASAVSGTVDPWVTMEKLPSLLPAVTTTAITRAVIGPLARALPVPGRELSTRCTVDSGLRQGWGPRGHQLGGQDRASRSRALCPTSSASESAARPGGRGRVLGGAAVTRPASSQRLAGPWPWAPVAVPGPFTKHRRAAGHGAWSSEQRAEALHVHTRTHMQTRTWRRVHTWGVRSYMHVCTCTCVGTHV